MKKIVLIFLMVMFFVQCKKDNASVQNTIEITDALGRKVKVPENITRIVAVNAGAMRFISYMEAIPLVVGIEETETRAKRPYNFAFPEIKKAPASEVKGTVRITPILAEIPCISSIPIEYILMI